MKQNTFVIGGELKFAEKFVERLNKRFCDELNLVITNHKTWDQSSSSRESIPSGTDLVLVLKSNCNHSLRNWARREAQSQSVKFIECSHKTAIAETDIRHCYQLPISTNLDTTQEELDLYETWSDFLGDRGYILPLLGMDDEGLFTGKDAYERMPWVREGKKKMIAKWDKLWVSYSKQGSDEVRATINLVASVEGRKATFGPLHSVNNGKSPYLKLLEIFKSFKEGSLGRSQVKMIADQWVRDAYLGTNLRDFKAKSNLGYALKLIFGLNLEHLSDETLEVLDEHFPKAGRPKAKKNKQKSVVDVVEKLDMTQPEILTQEAWDDFVAENPLPPQEKIEPVVEPPSEKVEPYVLLGSLKITPNDNVFYIGEVQLDGGVHIHGDINLEVDRIENNTLYGVKIKKG
jgi:hypothetical protein